MSSSPPLLAGQPGLAVVVLRSAALALEIAGSAKPAAALRGLSDLIVAGQAVDQHLAEVAAFLETGVAPDDARWDDVAARIAADSARLQAVNR